MTISIRSATTGGATSGISFFAINKPATVSDGDLLVIILGNDVGTILPFNDNWLSLGAGGSSTGNDAYIQVFAHFVDEADNEPSSYYFGLDSTVGYHSYWIGSLYTDDANIGLDQAISFANRQNDTSPNVPELTTSVNNVLAFAAWYHNSDPSTTPPGGSWDTRADDVGGSGRLSVCSQAFPTLGTGTGTPEITDVSATVDTEVAMILFRDGIAGDLRASQVAAYLEIERQSIQVSQVGAYIEVENKIIRVAHVGAYLEIEDIPPVTAQQKTIIMMY